MVMPVVNRTGRTARWCLMGCWVVALLLVGGCGQPGEVGPAELDVSAIEDGSAAAVVDAGAPKDVLALGACRDDGRWESRPLFLMGSAPAFWVDVDALDPLPGKDPDNDRFTRYLIAGTQFHPRQERHLDLLIRTSDTQTMQTARQELLHGHRLWLAIYHEEPLHPLVAVSVRDDGSAGFIGGCQDERVTLPLMAFAEHEGLSPVAALDALIREQYDVYYVIEVLRAWEDARHPAPPPAVVDPEDRVVDWDTTSPEELAQYEGYTLSFMPVPDWLRETERVVCGRSEIGWGTCFDSVGGGSLVVWVPPGGTIEVWVNARSDAPTGMLDERFGPIVWFDTDTARSSVDPDEYYIVMRPDPDGRALLDDVLNGRPIDRPIFTPFAPP
jgi:hypothetical protein